MANAVAVNSKNSLANSSLLSALSCSPPTRSPPTTPHTQLTPASTGIIDSGATGIYFAPDAPVSDKDPQAPPITVGTATGQVQRSSASATLALPQLPSDFPRTGHIMPGFQHTIIGVGPICDANFSVLFNPDSVKIFDPQGRVILSGWREAIGAKLWRMALIPDAAALVVVPDPPPLRPGAAQLATLSAYSAYDLPSVEALVRYLHAAAGFPVKST